MPASSEPRRLPRQPRGRRRVDTLLDAAAAELRDSGYEAATMCAIANRAGSSIGSLYQFFPNKTAITQALRMRYYDEFEQMWAPLASEARRLSIEELVARMVDSTVSFVERHPAFLALLDAPASTHAPAAVRARFQQLVAGFLLARRPRMSRALALRLATVTLQTVKAMNFLYRELSPRQRRPYIQEFKMLLRCYLESRIGPHGNTARRRQ
ncbi:MAG TPA: TetR/AcrR family transcriptional regulator [Bryobacteraceae bacterium]|nr:TetR/AcrR family transcriptional regulator [Bryobacteraceae bacterium]